MWDLEGVDGFPLRRGARMRSEGLTVYNINGIGKQFGDVPCQADKGKQVELRHRIQVYQNIDIAIGTRFPRTTDPKTAAWRTPRACRSSRWRTSIASASWQFIAEYYHQSTTPAPHSETFPGNENRAQAG